MDTEYPNIVFVFSDQHRFCDVGYSGNKEVKTPNLDALEKSSVNFQNMYSNCPLCVPARGTLLTGMHAFKHGAVANDLPIRPDCISIANVLNDAGYMTAYVGKWHLGGAPRDQFITHYNRLGFRYWRGNDCNHNYYKGYYDDNSNIRHKIEGYAPIGETNQAIEFMSAMKEKSSPFALFLGYGTPHDPYLQVPEEKYQKTLEKNISFRENVQENLQKGEISIEEYDLKKFYAGYYTHIQVIDEQIGRIVAWLDENHMSENTIVVYTSDHGDMLGSHGYLNKQMYFDESTRIPFLLYWKDHILPGKRKQLFSLVDVAPTILGLIGLKFPNAVDGKDLSEVLKNPHTEGGKSVYLYSYVPCHQAKYREVASWRAVTNGRMLLAVDENRKEICMYDNQKDPYQEKNVMNLPEYAEEKQKLLKELDKEVFRNDGYEQWEKLLEEKELDELWKESETFFAGLFKHC